MSAPNKPNKPEKEESLWKKFFDELSYDVPFARAFWTLFSGLFIREGKAVKSGWFAFLLFTGFAFWGGCHWASSDVNERLRLSYMPRRLIALAKFKKTILLAATQKRLIRLNHRQNTGH